jgi:arginyl-tRNA synthetase
MVHTLKNNLTQLIETWLAERGVEAPVVVLERTVDAKFGEYAVNSAMRYAKELKLAPLVIAQELVEHIQHAGLPEIDRVEFVPPGFVNIYFSEQVFIEHVEHILAQGTAFGQIAAHHGEKWVIEHTSPNPNKAMHLGHLRTNLVGMGLVRLLQTAGAEVVSDCVYNDRGIAIAKAMYGYLAFMKKDEATPTDIEYWQAHPDEWHTPETKGIKPDIFVTECYVQAEAAMKSPEVESVIRKMVVDWEASEEDTPTRALWATVLGFSYQGINRTLERVGNHWDKVWHEHQHYQKGKDYVQEGLEKGVFQTLEDGAVLTNLEADYGLSDTVLLKNDGTSLYITQDLALTDLKKTTYDADKLVWVVGPEQSMSFKQLFATCEQLGIGNVADFTHVTYGYVGLKGEDGGFQKMSSREGTVVLIDDVIDGVKETILQRFAADKKPADTQAAETLAVGAVKFAFLKSDRTQDITFDLEQSVDIHGDSGMYVLYTFVRTQSILRKAGERTLSEFVPTEGSVEHSLVRSLLYFEDVIKKSADDLSVHHIAQYLLELSSEFNSWYAKDMVLDDSVSEEYKLAITTAVGVTLQNGLRILGMETVDKM